MFDIPPGAIDLASLKTLKQDHPDIQSAATALAAEFSGTEINVRDPLDGVPDGIMVMLGAGENARNSPGRFMRFHWPGNWFAVETSLWRGQKDEYLRFEISDEAKSQLFLEMALFRKGFDSQTFSFKSDADKIVRLAVVPESAEGKRQLYIVINSTELPKIARELKPWFDVIRPFMNIMIDARGIALEGPHGRVVFLAETPDDTIAHEFFPKTEMPKPQSLLQRVQGAIRGRQTGGGAVVPAKNRYGALIDPDKAFQPPEGGEDVTDVWKSKNSEEIEGLWANRFNFVMRQLDPDWPNWARLQAMAPRANRELPGNVALSVGRALEIGGDITEPKPKAFLSSARPPISISIMRPIEANFDINARDSGADWALSFSGLSGNEDDFFGIPLDPESNVKTVQFIPEDFAKGQRREIYVTVKTMTELMGYELRQTFDPRERYSQDAQPTQFVGVYNAAQHGDVLKELLAVRIEPRGAILESDKIKIVIRAETPNPEIETFVSEPSTAAAAKSLWTRATELFSGGLTSISGETAGKMNFQIDESEQVQEISSANSASVTAGMLETSDERLASFEPASLLPSAALVPTPETPIKMIMQLPPNDEKSGKQALMEGESRRFLTRWSQPGGFMSGRDRDLTRLANDIETIFEELKDAADGSKHLRVQEPEELRGQNGTLIRVLDSKKGAGYLAVFSGFKGGRNEDDMVMAIPITPRDPKFMAVEASISQGQVFLFDWPVMLGADPESFARSALDMNSMLNIFTNTAISFNEDGDDEVLQTRMLNDDEPTNVENILRVIDLALEMSNDPQIRASDDWISGNLILFRRTTNRTIPSDVIEEFFDRFSVPAKTDAERSERVAKIEAAVNAIRSEVRSFPETPADYEVLPAKNIGGFSWQRFRKDGREVRDLFRFFIEKENSIYTIRVVDDFSNRKDTWSYVEIRKARKAGFDPEKEDAGRVLAQAQFRGLIIETAAPKKFEELGPGFDIQTFAPMVAPFIQSGLLPTDFSAAEWTVRLADVYPSMSGGPLVVPVRFNFSIRANTELIWANDPEKLPGSGDTDTGSSFGASDSSAPVGGGAVLAEEFKDFDPNMKWEVVREILKQDFGYLPHSSGQEGIHQKENSNYIANFDLIETGKVIVTDTIAYRRQYAITNMPIVDFAALQEVYTAGTGDNRVLILEASGKAGEGTIYHVLPRLGSVNTAASREELDRLLDKDKATFQPLNVSSYHQKAKAKRFENMTPELKWAAIRKFLATTEGHPESYGFVRLNDEAIRQARPVFLKDDPKGRGYLLGLSRDLKAEPNKLKIENKIRGPRLTGKIPSGGLDLRQLESMWQVSGEDVRSLVLISSDEAGKKWAHWIKQESEADFFVPVADLAAYLRDNKLATVSAANLADAEFDPAVRRLLSLPIDLTILRGTPERVTKEQASEVMPQPLFSAVIDSDNEFKLTASSDGAGYVPMGYEAYSNRFGTQ
ncbi:MAG: hypothetical protein KBC91_05930, partial [Candidatus Omnitrophica bacterium]|nr:hypothetical protein [Candidatus Omnitrophota bacterium]